MNNPIFYMPTKIIAEKDALKNHGIAVSALGKKALIVTGKSSSKHNGSLADLVELLQEVGITYFLFDEVEENPSVETVEKISCLGRDKEVDFIIGVGGGSPIDACKAAGVLMKNIEATRKDLFASPMLLSVPIVAIPTTAGTGTEVTPYAIVTDHEVKTKRGIVQKVFPVICFLDATYLMNTPVDVTINTSVDALSHLIEGYLSANANIYSDGLAESGLKLMGQCINEVKNEKLDFETREKLLIASCIGGMVISQSGTSLPHGMGYALTYNKGVPHGKANGVFLKSYMNFCKDKLKVKTILELIGFNNLNQFGDFLMDCIGEPIAITDEEIYEYASYMASNESKLRNHPSKVTRDDILDIYRTSLIRV
ncbi:iron-containing alcohol dehydrogenase family protein [Clostridium sp.]|uniref:iron-containing alcohol dehydrogenase family protein n=1 Tax=Clostridium sp. TaxID=1506 RepID=UPI002FC74808